MTRSVRGSFGGRSFPASVRVATIAAATPRLGNSATLRLCDSATRQLCDSAIRRHRDAASRKRICPRAAHAPISRKKKPPVLGHEPPHSCPRRAGRTRGSCGSRSSSMRDVFVARRPTALLLARPHGLTGDSNRASSTATQRHNGRLESPESVSARWMAADSVLGGLSTAWRNCRGKTIYPAGAQ